MWTPDGPDSSPGTRAGWSSDGPVTVPVGTREGWTELHIKELQANTEALTFQTSSTLQKIGILNSSRPIAVTSASGLQKVATVPGGTRTINFSGNGAFGFPPLTAFTTTYSTAGSQTFTIPRNADYLDIILLGGGASGETGSGVLTEAGNGGNPGSWFSITLQRGVDIPWSATSVSLTVGSGGTQPANSDLDGPNPGGATTATVNGVTYSAAGGDGEASGQSGGSPGNHTRNGTTYTGGTGGTGNAGSPTAPGAGGAGGNGGVFGNRTRGAAGSVGQAWVKAYQ